MKPIVHCFDGFYPASGGVAAYIQDIAATTIDPGLVLTDAIKGLPDREELRPGFLVQRVGPENPALGAHPRVVNTKPLFPVRFAADWVRLRSKMATLRRTPSRMVQVHGLNLPSTFFRIGLAQQERLARRWFSGYDRLGVPTIGTVHGLLSRTGGPRNEGLERGFYRRFDHLVCVDRSLIQFITERWDEIGSRACFHWCPNAVDTEFFPYTEPVDHGPIRVGFVGRLESSRGIEALRSLAQALPTGIELRIAGAGNFKDIVRFESLMDGLRVRSQYNLNHAGVRALLESVHVLFNPVLVDGISRASLEALAVGRPVAMFRGQDRGPVVDGDTGFLIDPTAEAIAHWAQTLPDRLPELRGMGERGRRRVVAEYSLERFGERVREIYSHVEEGGR